jgi:putative transposase
VRDRFEFIDGEYATRKHGNQVEHPSRVKMCEWLGVSRSGYYDWRTKPQSATARRREELKALIVHFFEASDGTYGYRRIHADLAGHGVACGLELVHALMREPDLRPCQSRPRRHSLTVAVAEPHQIPDLMRRDFTADAPGQKLIGDITYIPTWQGWLFLAAVIDCHTREVIGWATGDHYRTPLIQEAITMAARNHHLAANAIFHSDRGSNHTSADYAATLKKLEIRQSVGRIGICYDAMADSVFASLRNERVHRTEYPTRQHGHNDIARYIETHYNSRRRHSGLDYKAPRQARHEFEDGQLVAGCRYRNACPEISGRLTIWCLG